MQVTWLALAALAAANPIAQQASRNTCGSITAVISALRLYRPASSFCITYLGVETRTSWSTTVTATTWVDTTVTSTTSVETITAPPVTATAETQTATAPTSTETAEVEIITVDTQTITDEPVFTTTQAEAVTETLPTETITASPSTSTETAEAVTITLPVQTITADPVIVPSVVSRTTTVCAGPPAKRDAEPILFPLLDIPLILAPFAPKLSSGCSCLSIPAPTVTSVTRIKTTSTNTIISNVVGITTTTPTETSTPLTIVTPLATTTPTSYFTPLTTITPTETITETPTVSETPLFTTTPVVLETETPTVTESPSITTTPTSTSVSTSYSTVLVGVTAATAAPRLARPTAISRLRANGLTSPNFKEDSSYSFTLPFPLTIYGFRSSTAILSTNGWLSLTGSASYNDIGYANTPLPRSRENGDRSRLAEVAYAVYWNDMETGVSTRQGIYYQVDGQSPNRNITFEWLLSQRDDVSRIFQFTALFQESKPGVAIYNYYRMTRSVSQFDGTFGTVGLQRHQVGPLQNPPISQFNQYVYNQAGAIYPGLEITFDPATNTWFQSNQDSMSGTCPLQTCTGAGC